MRRFLVLLLFTVGCHAQHYMVKADSTALENEAGQQIAELSRYSHGKIEDRVGPRYRVTAHGSAGYVAAADVRVFGSLDPVWDGGSDYRETLNRERRAIRVDLEGNSWKADMRDAVAEGRIRKGMSQDQVEVAWGWPLAVEPEGTGEIWIYRRQGTSLQRVDSSYLFPYPFGFGWAGGVRAAHFHGALRPWQRLRVEVSVQVEYRVHFGRNGRVSKVSRRSWIED